MDNKAKTAKRKKTGNPAFRTTQTLTIDRKQPFPWSGMIITFFLLVVAGGGGWFMFVKYGEFQKQKELKEKQRQEKHTQLQAELKEEKLRKEMERKIFRQAKLQTAFNNAMKYAKGNAKNPALVKVYLIKMKAFFAGTEFEARVQDEIKKLNGARNKEAADLMQSLEKKAKVFGDKKEYDKAALVFANYTGPFEKRSLVKRKRKVSYYNALHKERQRELAAFDKVMKETADLLLDGKVERAVAALDKAKNGAELKNYRDSLEKAAKTLRQIKDTDKLLEDSFKKSIGKIIRVETSKGKLKGKVASVGGTYFMLKLKIGKAIAKKKVKFRRLTVREKMKRIGASEEHEKLCFGLSAVRKGSSFVAREKYFADKDNPLFAALNNKLNNLDPKSVKASLPPEKPEPEEKEKTAGKPEPDKLQVKPIIHKPKKMSGRDYDDKQQEIRCRVSLTNKSKSDLDNYSISLYLIGKSVVNKKEFRLVKIFNEAVSVKKGRNINTAENSVILNFDNNAAVQYGCTYEGWLVAVKDDFGDLFKIKASNTKFAKISKQIMGFDSETSFDKKGHKVDSVDIQRFN